MSDFNRSNIAPPDELLERHLAFWQRSPVGGPLVRVDDMRMRIDLPAVECVYGPQGGKQIGPDQAGVERFLQHVEWHNVLKPGEADLFDTLPPYIRIPWLEAIAGCPVIPEPTSDSIWAQEPKSVPSEPRTIEANFEWLDAMMKQVARLSDDDSLPCPTAQTVLRGPGDLAKAILGAEVLGIAMADEASWLEDFLRACTDLFIDVARKHLQRIKPLWGGYFNFFGLWSPEPCVRVQEDFQSLLSPAHYRRWLRPCDERIVNQFPYSMFHMHSGSLFLAEDVCTIPGLRGLQVHIDDPPYAPPIVEQIPELQKIQSHVPLLVEGSSIASQDIERLSHSLKHEGLAIRSSASVRTNTTE